MLEEIEKRGVKMAASMIPIKPADPNFKSFVINVLPRCVEAGIGVLVMKTLAYGRFFGGNQSWQRTEVSRKPVIPKVISLDAFLWLCMVSACHLPCQRYGKCSTGFSKCCHSARNMELEPSRTSETDRCISPLRWSRS